MALATFNAFFQDQIRANVQGLTSSEPANTYVIVHGYQNTGGNAGNGFKAEQWMTNIATALWRRENNANIILVDWAKAAGTLNYDNAARDSLRVGEEIAQFLQGELIGYISDPSRVTLIGHSLGAQAAGAAGKVYQRDTGKKLGQIIGLDPAGPAFEVQGNLPPLAPGDAQRVVALHTSQVLGYNNRLADFDIYTDIFIKSSRFFPSTEDHSAAHTVLTQLLRGTAYKQSGQYISELSLNTLVNSEYTGEFFGAQVTRSSDGSSLFIDKRNSNIAEVIAGSASDDSLRGGVASDRISGDGGNDSLYGEAGNDILHGGVGNDILRGGAGNDFLSGDQGNDVLTGSDTGNTSGEIDFLRGGGGRDIFVLGTADTGFYRDSNNGNDPFNSNPFIGDSRPTEGASFAIIQDYEPGIDFIQVNGPLSNYSLAPVSINLPFEIPPGRGLPFQTISGTGIYLNKSNSLIPDPFLGFDNPAGVPLGQPSGGDLIGIVRNVLTSNSTGVINGNRFISLTNQSFISASNNTPAITFAGDDSSIDDSDIFFTLELASEGQELGSLVYNLDDFFPTETLTVQVEDDVLQQTDSFFHNLIGIICR